MQTLEWLPRQIEAQIRLERWEEAADTVSRFSSDWNALELRLLALDLGYLDYIRRIGGQQQLEAANEWINPALPIVSIASLPTFTEQVEALRQQLARLRGPQVTAGVPGENPFRLAATVERLSTAVRLRDRAQSLDEGHLLLAEWPALQDRIVHLIAVCLSFIARAWGESEVAQANLAVGREAQALLDAIVMRSAADSGETNAFEQRLQRIITLLTAHSMEGYVGEDAEGATIHLQCASGLRMWARGVEKFGLTSAPYPWSLQRAGLPYYCARCLCHGPVLPRLTRGQADWYVYPPSGPDGTCQWIVPRDPAKIPLDYWLTLGVR